MRPTCEDSGYLPAASDVRMALTWDTFRRITLEQETLKRIIQNSKKEGKSVVPTVVQKKLTARKVQNIFSLVRGVNMYTCIEINYFAFSKASTYFPSALYNASKLYLLPLWLALAR